MSEFINNIFIALVVMSGVLVAGSIAIVHAAQPKKQKKKETYEVEMQQYRATHKARDTVYMFFCKNDTEAVDWLQNKLNQDLKDWTLEKTGTTKTVEKELKK